MSREGQNAELEELARRGFEAYNSRDLEALARIMHPDVELHAGRDLPNRGTFHGHEGFLQWNATWDEAWEEFTIEATAIEALGDEHILADVRQTARGAGSGIGVEMDVHWAFEVKDGQVTRMHLYLTREEALDAIEGWRRGDEASA
jgi:ketosteroid isomerase-like protein